MVELKTVVLQSDDNGIKLYKRSIEVMYVKISVKVVAGFERWKEFISTALIFQKRWHRERFYQILITTNHSGRSV